MLARWVTIVATASRLKVSKLICISKVPDISLSAIDYLCFTVLEYPTLCLLSFAEAFHDSNNLNRTGARDTCSGKISRDETDIAIERNKSVEKM